MALRKKITESNGIVTEYHKINSICIYGKENRKQEQSQVVEGYDTAISLSSYVNQSIRDKSEEYSVLDRYYRINIPVAEVETKNIYEVVYTELKKMDIFKDAEDC